MIGTPASLPYVSALAGPAHANMQTLQGVIVTLAVQLLSGEIEPPLPILAPFMSPYNPRRGPFVESFSHAPSTASLEHGQVKHLSDHT